MKINIRALHCFISVLLILTGSQSAPDITSKLNVLIQAPPVVAPPVVAPSVAETVKPDAEILLKLNCSEVNETYYLATLVITNALFADGITKNTKTVLIDLRNSPLILRLPIFFQEKALNGEAIHLALMYNDGSYPYVWEKSATILRGQILDIDASLSTVITPVGIALPDGYKNKLSPNTFYKDSDVTFKSLNFDNHRGKSASRGKVLVIYHDPKDDPKVVVGQDVLKAAAEKAFPAFAKVMKDIAQEVDNEKLTNIATSTRLTGIKAYDRIKDISSTPAKNIVMEASLNAGFEFHYSFTPSIIGEYKIIIWSENNGQYALSEQIIYVYEKL